MSAKVIWPQHEETYLLTRCSLQRFRSACAHWSIYCQHEKSLPTWLSKMCLEKILIRLCEWAGWSEFLLDAHVWRYVFQCCGAFATCHDVIQCCGTFATCHDVIQCCGAFATCHDVIQCCGAFATCHDVIHVAGQIRVYSFEKAHLNIVRILVYCGDKVPYCFFRLYRSISSHQWWEFHISKALPLL